MWGLAHESHHHTRVWGVSGHHVNHLGPCGNIVHSCIHSVVLILLPGVSTAKSNRRSAYVSRILHVWPRYLALAPRAHAWQLQTRHACILSSPSSFTPCTILVGGYLKVRCMVAIDRSEVAHPAPNPRTLTSRASRQAGLVGSRSRGRWLSSRPCQERAQRPQWFSWSRLKTAPSH